MGGGGTPPPSSPSGDEEDEEDDGMLRMSFLEHLEELRSRIFKALGGVGIAFLVSLTFSSQLWDFVSKPATAALTSLGYEPSLVMIEPMESFNITCVLYQVWAFISPGLYRKERRWATPFILISAGLFILGGVFAYFVVFRYGLTFLLSIGQGHGVKPMVSMSYYFDLFFNVVVGVGLVFELPILIFFLTLQRVVSPVFLVNHSRYAILAIFIIAAIVTPTPDVFNLMLFALPMCALFYVGIFAGWLLVLHREGRKFPWRKAILITVGVLLLVAGVLYLAITKYGYKPVPHWPFLVH
jgi:sec-independent protein translocase protein TatC